MGELSYSDECVEALRQLAQANGISTEFWNWRGCHCYVPPFSLIKVLAALGIDINEASSQKDILQALADTYDRPWLRVLPDCTVAREGSSRNIYVHVPHGMGVSIKCLCEDGSVAELDQVDRYVNPREIRASLIGEATFAIPQSLPLGYHRLSAFLENGEVYSAPLIVVPERLEHPFLNDKKRHWGVSVQLYSVRSEKSWGIGDAWDLADINALCAQQGADFVTVNPIHSSSVVLPMEPSPYLPVTRQWINPIYIRPEAIPEYCFLTAESREKIRELRITAAGIGYENALIDRDRVWEAKRKALEIIYSVPRPIHRDAEFQEFIDSAGDSLADFAAWSALQEYKAGENLPQKGSHFFDVLLETYRSQLQERIRFWQWCQWIVSRQMHSAQRCARDLGMDIGVMADLAVGVHPYGSEVWANSSQFATDISVGAPPDMYSQQGQDWSQPPFSPNALAREGYEPFRAIVRATLANAGAVRIDHILGMFRLWWIPCDCPASEGAYVSYDHEAMIGIILLEAQRAGALVIGEDLGTVEPWVRDYLVNRGILGTSVLWFEKGEDGWPIEPECYRTRVLATVNTHDLPPTAGYLEGIQTELRDRLGLLIDDVENVRHEDSVERERMMIRLRDRGLLKGGEVSLSETVDALYSFIAQTPSVLVAAALVDFVGDKRPQNLPGTHRQYPNWCIPLCDSQGREIHVEDLEKIFSTTSLVRVLQSGVNEVP